jgi:hypothetical protein
LTGPFHGILELFPGAFSTVIEPGDINGVRTMHMHNISNTTLSFDRRALERELPDVFGNWTQKAMIEQAASCFLDSIRLRNGQPSRPMFPEAEDLGSTDLVSLAEVVGKIGAERFGKALKKDLDVNRLSNAHKFGRLNVDKFIADFDEGKFDSRFFGEVQPVAVKEPVRDASGLSRRDRLELKAGSSLDRQRIDWAGISVTTDDLLQPKGEYGLWPTSEELEDQGVDIVALERARSIIGTEALGRLHAARFNLYTLALRVSRGFDVGRLYAAFEAGLVQACDLHCIREESLKEMLAGHTTRAQ